MTDAQEALIYTLTEKYSKLYTDHETHVFVGTEVGDIPPMVVIDRTIRTPNKNSSLDFTRTIVRIWTGATGVTISSVTAGRMGPQHLLCWEDPDLIDQIDDHVRSLMAPLVTIGGIVTNAIGAFICVLSVVTIYLLIRYSFSF